MRKALLFLFLLLSFLSFANEVAEEEDNEIIFRGGLSSIVLREGKESLSLTEGAEVIFGSMNINATVIYISGQDWRFVECEDNVVITDEERGIEIKTQSLWFDREEERILCSSWLEIEDTVNEVSLTAAVMEYSLKDERLELNKDVSILKSTDEGLMRCRAEDVVFSRLENTLTLRGSAEVDWKGNKYNAEVINVDLLTDTITLEGRISGSING